MFDETIKTFLSVAKSRSLSKTAEEMYLAPNAIRKRIIRLETQTGLKLFVRSNRGVELTEAGASLLKDISVLYEQYQQAVEKAYKIQAGNNRIITVGMATTCSDTFTISSWHEIRKKLNQNPIHVAYYGNTLKDCDDLFRDVGHKIDVCIDFFDERIAQKYGLHSKKISEFPMYIGIPDNVVITEGKAISLDEIKGRSVAVLEYGRSAVFDRIRDLIKREYPEIAMETVSEFSIRNFNDNYMKKNCFLLTETQTDLYPFYSFYPFACDYKVPFGIYYGDNASKDVMNFIDIITMSKE